MNVFLSCGHFPKLEANVAPLNLKISSVWLSIVIGFR